MVKGDWELPQVHNHWIKLSISMKNTCKNTCIFQGNVKGDKYKAIKKQMHRRILKHTRLQTTKNYEDYKIIQKCTIIISASVVHLSLWIFRAIDVSQKVSWFCSNCSPIRRSLKSFYWSNFDVFKLNWFRAEVIIVHKLISCSYILKTRYSCEYFEICLKSQANTRHKAIKKQY